MKFAREIKTFLALTAPCCSLLWVEPSLATGLDISPPAPEAYQPFVLTFSVCYSGQNPVNMAIVTSSDSITLTAPYVDFECEVDEKKARIEGLPGGTYSIKRARGGLIYLGTEPVEDPSPTVLGSVVIAPAPPSRKVYAFYNLFIKHYFITASTSERDSLLSGGGGGGWEFTDPGFRAWPAEGPAPAAAKPVCRFYSSLVNSHFYTAGAGECESLKQPSSGWTYEGIAFRALVPTKGSCYPGTHPVWRLYNDRFAQSDSNHRFVTSVDTYRHMIASGWVGEGVAFCSPES